MEKQNPDLDSDGFVKLLVEGKTVVISCLDLKTAIVTHFQNHTDALSRQPLFSPDILSELHRKNGLASHMSNSRPQEQIQMENNTATHKFRESEYSRLLGMAQEYTKTGDIDEKTFRSFERGICIPREEGWITKEEHAELISMVRSRVRKKP